MRRRVISRRAGKGITRSKRLGGPPNRSPKTPLFSLLDETGELVNPIGNADAIGDDVVRELHLRTIEYGLKRLEERVERHLGERRKTRRHRFFDGDAAEEHVAPGDPARL